MFKLDFFCCCFCVTCRFSALLNLLLFGGDSMKKCCSKKFSDDDKRLKIRLFHKSLIGVVIQDCPHLHLNELSSREYEVSLSHTFFCSSQVEILNSNLQYLLQHFEPLFIARQ